MSLGRERKMVDRGHPSLPVVRQCALLETSRSGLYHRRKGSSEEDQDDCKVRAILQISGR